MFIGQVMYAEGLVKVMQAILRCADYEWTLDSRRRTLALLEAAYTELAHNIHGRSAEFRQCGLLVSKERRHMAQLEAQYQADRTLLERCKVAPAEYYEKFQQISADCLRIGHGSVQPPAWA